MEHQQPVPACNLNSLLFLIFLRVFAVRFSQKILLADVINKTLVVSWLIAGTRNPDLQVICTREREICVATVLSGGRNVHPQ